MNKLLTTITVLGQVYLLMPLTAKAALTAVPEGLEAGGGQISDIASTAGGAETDLTSIIANGINVILGFLGILFLLFVVYAGFLYLTDQGEGKKAEKARKLLTTAIIGIVIIVAAYAISNYVIGAMVSVIG
jgi:hypothetical protein